MRNLVVIIVGIIACATSATIVSMFFDPPTSLVISGIVGVPIGIIAAELWQF